MRYAAKTDANQADIVRAFRSIGATVQILSMVGHGCPDTLVGFRGRNILVEIKNSSLVLSKQQLTKDQIAWHAGWNGQVIVANSIQSAVVAVIEAAK